MSVTIPFEWFGVAVVGHLYQLHREADNIPGGATPVYCCHPFTFKMLWGD